MISLGLLPKLKMLLQSKNTKTRKETLWVIANILAEDNTTIALVFSEDVLTNIISQALADPPLVHCYFIIHLLTMPLSLDIGRDFALY